MGESALGNITCMENLAEHIAGDLEVCKGELADLHRQFEAAKLQSQKMFSNEEKLAQLQRKKVELDLVREFKDSTDEILEPDKDSAEWRRKQMVRKVLLSEHSPNLNGSPWIKSWRYSQALF